MQPVREAVSYRGLFTAGWFGVREKHYSRLEIYDRLRANEQADDFFDSCVSVVLCGNSETAGAAVWKLESVLHGQKGAILHRSPAPHSVGSLTRASAVMSAV